MTLPQQKLRELVFQFLFSNDFIDVDEVEVVESLMHIQKVSKKWVRLAHERMVSVKQHLPEIDKQISDTSEEYAFERISRVEKNVLRLGVFELFFDEEIPSKVAISEAIRLGRKFATPHGALFINAVLDEIYKKSSPDKRKEDPSISNYSEEIDSLDDEIEDLED